MNNEEELFTVSCIHCNDQEFKFSRNLLGKNNDVVRFVCPKCEGETKITRKDTEGIIIGKY